MSDTSTGDPGKPMEKPSEDISEAMEQLSVTDNETSTPPKNLSDMPLDVVALIIERSDYKEQLILRKVCKSLRALVDKQTPSCKDIYIDFWVDRITFWFNERRAVYNKPEFACSNDDFEKIAFDDLAFTLKNPKLQLETFDVRHPLFGYDDYFGSRIREQYEKLKNVLSSINHQISAKRAVIAVVPFSGPQYLLPFLKPGVLEEISIRTCRCGLDVGDISENITRLSFLEQWKQAEVLELEYGQVGRPEGFPVKDTTHFKRFHLSPFSIESDELVRLRDHICTLKTFEYFLIKPYCPFDAQHLCYEVGDPAYPDEHTEYLSYYRIPDSDDYLEFMFYDRTIEIWRCRIEPS